MIENSLTELATTIGVMALVAAAILVMVRPLLKILEQMMTKFDSALDRIAANADKQTGILDGIIARIENSQTVNQTEHKVALELIQKMDTTLNTQTKLTAESNVGLEAIQAEILAIKGIVTQLLEVVTRLEETTVTTASTIKDTRASIDHVGKRLGAVETKLEQNGGIPKPGTTLSDSQESVPSGG